jgi:hypothetical protein
MGQEFQYNVFLSHSAKDKAVVRPLAERLPQDGPNVWFDEWVLAPGDNIPAKIEKGSTHSNILRNEGGQMCRCVELTPQAPSPSMTHANRFANPCCRSLRLPGPVVSLV